MKMQKCLNLGQNKTYLGIFGLEFGKAIVEFEINIVIFVKFQNLEKKRKQLNLGQKMPYLGIFELKFQKTVVLF